VSIAISAQTILPVVPIAYLHDVRNLDKVTTRTPSAGLSSPARSPPRTRP
jgi:hypothetical protein